MAENKDNSTPQYYTFLKKEKSGLLTNYRMGVNPITSFDIMHNRVFSTPHLNGYFVIYITAPNLNLQVHDPDIDMKAEVPIGEIREDVVRINNEKRQYKSINNIARSSVIYQIFKRNPDLVKTLALADSRNNSDGKIIDVWDENTERYPFIRLLTNYGLGIELKDTTLKTVEAIETNRGYKQIIPLHNTESRSGGELSIPYYNDDNLLIFNLHQVWVDYINGVKLGIYEPSKYSVEQAELDYMSSIYYFMFKPDMETLTYWAKYTGVFPINIPHSSFASKRFSIDPVDEISITYAYSYKEEMELEILKDFVEVLNPDGKENLAKYKDLFNYISEPNSNMKQLKFTHPSNSYNKDAAVMSDPNKLSAFLTGEIPAAVNGITSSPSKANQDKIESDPNYLKSAEERYRIKLKDRSTSNWGFENDKYSKFYDPNFKK